MLESEHASGRLEARWPFDLVACLRRRSLLTSLEEA